MELLTKIILVFLQTNIMYSPQILKKLLKRSKILIWLVVLQYSNRVVLYYDKLISRYGSLEDNSGNTRKLEYNVERILNQLMQSYDFRLNVHM